MKPIVETHNLKLVFSSLKVFRTQLQNYFGDEIDFLPLNSDSDLYPFIDSVLSSERLLSCPFVRSFFKFDKGKQQEIPKESYRSTSFAGVEKLLE